MTTPLLGLIGKKRAGKDTFASALVERHGFRRFAFADPLRAVMLDVNPWLEPTSYPGHLAPFRCIRLRDLVQAIGWEEAKENPEVRRLLQAHGVAIREHVGSDVWVRATMAKVAEVRSPMPSRVTRVPWVELSWPTPYPVVITDVRFPNEATAIRAAGGRLVRIVRPSSASDDSHISETALDEFHADFVIWNAGPREELLEAASDLYTRI